MRTSAFACAAILLFAAGAASADGTAASCMEYREVPHPDQKQHELHLSNTCSKPMSCGVSWTVTCGKKVTTTQKAAAIGASGEASWVASAASCDDDWSIDTSWTCRPSR
jgi:hypothetical protein